MSFKYHNKFEIIKKNFVILSKEWINKRRKKEEIKN